MPVPRPGTESTCREREPSKQLSFYEPAFQGKVAQEIQPQRQKGQSFARELRSPPLHFYGVGNKDHFKPFFHPPALRLGSSTCKTRRKTPTARRCREICQLEFSVRSRCNYTAIGGSQQFRKLREKQQTPRLDRRSNSQFPPKQNCR